MSTKVDTLPPLEPHNPEHHTQLLTALAELPPLAIVTEQYLAQLFRRHPSSVKRAVQRGELPPPVSLFGINVWTVAVILDHLSTRLESERKAVAQTVRRIAALRPGAASPHRED